MESIYLIASFILLLIALAWYVWKVGNRNAKEARYKIMYANFKAMLYDPLRPVNRTSWKELNLHFTELEDLRVNDEMTDILRGEFLKLYEPVTDEIEKEFDEMMSGHEFDPSMIFVGE